MKALFFPHYACFITPGGVRTKAFGLLAKSGRVKREIEPPCAFDLGESVVFHPPLSPPSLKGGEASPQAFNRQEKENADEERSELGERKAMHFSWDFVLLLPEVLGH